MCEFKGVRGFSSFALITNIFRTFFLICTITDFVQTVLAIDISGLNETKIDQ